MGKKSKVIKSKKLASTATLTDVSKLVEQAELALEKAEPELALKFYERAHSINNTNTSIMDSLAEVLLELNEPERAYQLFTRSIELEPSSNPCKYLYLAQLQSSHEALLSYRTGISLLTAELTNFTNSNNLEKSTGIKVQLSKAYNGIAELYLTDLCFEENAEQECENAVNQSLMLDPSLDTKHLLASLRISQTRMSEACDILEEIYHAIKQNREMLARRTVIEELNPHMTASAFSSSSSQVVAAAVELQDDEIYSEELCTTTAKMLIECSTLRPVLSRYAVDILTSLLDHNDENIQLWYLAGVAELGPENHSEAADLDASNYYLTQAKEMIDEIRKNHPTSEPILEEEYSLILHHLRIVEQMSASLGEGHHHRHPPQDERDEEQDDQDDEEQKGVRNEQQQQQQDDDEEWSDEEEDREGEGDEDMEVADTNR